MRSYEIISNKNFLGINKLLSPRNAEVKHKDGCTENNAQIVNSDILFSSQHIMYFLLILFHDRVVIFKMVLESNPPRDLLQKTKSQARLLPPGYPHTTSQDILLIPTLNNSCLFLSTRIILQPVLRSPATPPIYPSDRCHEVKRIQSVTQIPKFFVHLKAI